VAAPGFSIWGAKPEGARIETPNAPRLKRRRRWGGGEWGGGSPPKHRGSEGAS